MKVLVGIVRIFVGILFIISGFIKLNDPVGFSYVKREDANLVVRRVGGAAGTAYTDKIEERSIPPNYFLWVENSKEIAKSINNHDFNIHDTVGPESLTKAELTIFLNHLTSKEI